MAKKKSKKNQPKLSTGAIIAIVIGVIAIFGIIFDADDSDYDEADAKWQQHTSILMSDEVRLQEIVNDYCTGELYREDVEKCVDMMSPMLSSYFTHISSAQSFLEEEGDEFGNEIELSGYLDKKSVYGETLANNVNTLVNNYNSQQASSSSMIDDEDMMTILKILALAI